MSVEARNDGTLPPVIVLAAGRSSRMGGPKGLVDVGGKPWLVHQIDALGACGVAWVVVVLGHDHARYVEALPWLEAGGGASPWGNLRVEVVVNPAPERGPFSSLVTGCAHRRGSAAFVLPVDVPAAAPFVWSALAVGLTEDIDACIPTHEGRGGHPVLCSARFLDVVEQVAVDRPEARLDEQLRRAPHVVRVDVADARVRLNLNTPEDWATILR